MLLAAITQWMILLQLTLLSCCKRGTRHIPLSKKIKGGKNEKLTLKDASSTHISDQTEELIDLVRVKQKQNEAKTKKSSQTNDKCSRDTTRSTVTLGATASTTSTTTGRTTTTTITENRHPSEQHEPSESPDRRKAKKQELKRKEGLELEIRMERQKRAEQQRLDDEELAQLEVPVPAVTYTKEDAELYGWETW